MSNITTDFPIENWLADRVLDPDLKGPIARARAEFQDKTDSEVKELWREFQSVLQVCFKEYGRSPPTYSQPFTVFDEPEPGSVKYGYGYESEHVDFVKVFQILFDDIGRNPRISSSLLKFFAKLDREQPIAICKALALLILRESSDRNPKGALKAAGLLASVDGHLRPRIDEAARLSVGRRKGGKVTASQRRAGAKERHDAITKDADRLTTSGTDRRNIASILATRHRVSPHTVRRILSRRSKEKKRT